MRRYGYQKLLSLPTLPLLLIVDLTIFSALHVPYYTKPSAAVWGNLMGSLTLREWNVSRQWTASWLTPPLGVVNRMGHPFHPLQPQGLQSHKPKPVGCMELLHGY